ncbi:MAG: hypothetical protein KIS61_08110, partial [Candidatus Eremiobacteraeota bacterium]|nr:hypothetical protein [Candidatus Eremiobacteraeota bacterium]
MRRRSGLARFSWKLAVVGLLLVTWNWRWNNPRFEASGCISVQPGLGAAGEEWSRPQALEAAYLQLETLLQSVTAQDFVFQKLRRDRFSVRVRKDALRSLRLVRKEPNLLCLSVCAERTLAKNACLEYLAFLRSALTEQNLGVVKTLGPQYEEAEERLGKQVRKQEGDLYRLLLEGERVHGKELEVEVRDAARLYQRLVENSRRQQFEHRRMLNRG